MTDAQPTPPAVPAAVAPPTARLLVVDDTEASRDMLARRLERKGYTVLQVGDGPSALRTVDEQAIDLVLLDIMMPGMDGVEVLRRLRAERGPAELPVIMQTARADSQSMVEALGLGANDYVTKPIDFPVVLARVEKELRTVSDAGALRQSQRQRRSQSSGDVGIGGILAGRYRLEEKIGSGNFGSVYRAHHLELDTPVAVKILQTRAAETADAIERFRTEGRSACMVRHPNAVTVHDFTILGDGTAFLVMELLEGHTLSRELRLQGRLSLARVDEVLRPVGAALAEAHAGGIVHRDIKPDNIFIHRDRQGEVVKVLDFGIAKLVGQEIAERRLTADGFVLGTPAYMAPERLRDEPYDGRSDVYSLGVSLFQMLTGGLPFQPDEQDPMALLMKHLKEPPPAPRSLEPSIPEDVDRLVLACLSKKPEERPPLTELTRGVAAAAERAEAVDHHGDDAAERLSRARFDDDSPTRLVDAPRTSTPSGRSTLGERLARAVRRLFT